MKKNIGNATIRNKIKRKLKSAFQKISKEIPKLFKGKLSYIELGSGAIDKIKLLIN